VIPLIIRPQGTWEHLWPYTLTGRVAVGCNYCVNTSSSFRALYIERYIHEAAKNT
jgi:hypothetical protein